jgi:hypothetical protein
VVTVSLQTHWGAPATASGFAFQTGTGSWQAMTPGRSTYNFEVPPGESRYGFSVRCTDRQEVQTFQATVSDATTWTIPCHLGFTGTASYQVNYDARALPGARRVNLYDAFGWAASSDLLTGQLSPVNRLPAVQDLAMTVSDASVPARIIGARIMRDVNVPAGSPYSFTFSSADATNPAGGTVQSFAGTVPSGWGSEWSVSYQSPRGTGFVLHWGPPGGGTFATLAEPAGGSYAVLASAFGPEGAGVGGVMHVLTGDGTTFAPSLPGRFTTASVTHEAFPTFSGLTYPPLGLPLEGFALDLRWSRPGEPSRGWMALLTRRWLGDATSYRVPNLSALPGFSGFRPEGSVFWGAGPFGLRATWTAAAPALASLQRALGTQQRAGQDSVRPLVIVAPGVQEMKGAVQMGTYTLP